MKPGKNLTVEMKAEIQGRVLREVAELGEEEAQRRRAERFRAIRFWAVFCGQRWQTAKDPLSIRLPPEPYLTRAEIARSIGAARCRAPPLGAAPAQHTPTGASEKILKIWQGAVSSSPGISV